MGHGAGKGSREALGLSSKGPTRLISDLCLFEPDPETSELIVTAIHPGVTREMIQAQCGWPVHYAAQVGLTPAPTDNELAVLRDLQARTKQAHAA